MSGVTTIIVDGVEKAVPGAYTSIDASALDVPTQQSVGIIGMLGTGVGGKPYSALVDVATDVQKAKTSGQVKRLVRDGDLREVGAVLFKPGVAGGKIQGGAAQVVLMKVNPAVAAHADFVNADGNALRITAADYGNFTNQIKVTIAAGTNGGKKVVIDFENTTEIHDDLGLTGKATLIYAGGSDGATTATVANSGTVMTLAMTRVDAGLDTGFTQAPGASSLEVVSANAGDTTQTVTVLGLDASNVPQSVIVTLNGTTPVAITGTWNLETAIVMSAVAVGTVTLRIASAGATVVQLTAGQTSKGKTVLDIPVVSGTLTVVASGATTKKLVLRGVTAAGVALSQAVTLNGTTPVTITGLFARYTSIELGNVEAARNVTLAASMVVLTFTSFDTLAKLEDKIESVHSDFTWTALIGNQSEVLSTSLDIFTAVTMLTLVTINAVLADIITQVNATSTLGVASRLTPGTGAPTNIGPIFLAGGHEGDAGNPNVPTALFADWQAGLDLMKQLDVNTVIVNTSDAAVHAALDEHIAFMCGQGQMERDAKVGAATNETKTALKARVLALNTRHIAVFAQDVPLFDTDGVLTYQPPYFQAALVAAGQAGVSVGTPLTEAFFDVKGPPRQHSSWNPIEDGDEMIKAGLSIMRHVDGTGVKLVRGNTSYLASTNVVFSEASANQALNFAVRAFRARLQLSIGKKGFKGSVRDAKAKCIGVLDDLTKGDDPILVAYTNLVVTLIADRMDVEVGMAPVLPINFAPAKVSVFTTTITA